MPTQNVGLLPTPPRPAKRIMILPSRHSPSVIKPSQAMRAALADRQRGGTPVRLVRCQSFDDFPAFRNA